MKKALGQRVSGVILVLCAAFLYARVGIAQDAVLEWYTFDAGGTTVTGAAHVLRGTMGQQDAWVVRGTNSVLHGGFWQSVILVQTEGAPVLRFVGVETNTVTIAWPNPSTGYQLEEAGDLDGTNWTVVAETPTVIGDEKQVTVGAHAVPWFYRLNRP